jgi:protein required for attachment to host cells
VEEIMGKHLVLVADGTRARIFTLEHAEDPRADMRLMERFSLVNPEHEIRATDRFSSPRSESRGHVHGHWYGTDDHRNRQDEQHERRFAGLAASETMRIAREIGATHLAIVAAPKMLGLIRSEGENLFSLGMEIHEDSSEVSRLPVQRLQAHLERAEILPPSMARE